jgi:hypothetical protein
MAPPKDAFKARESVREADRKAIQDQEREFVKEVVSKQKEVTKSQADLLKDRKKFEEDRRTGKIDMSLPVQPVEKKK